jgi:hypothetical protein
LETHNTAEQALKKDVSWKDDASQTLLMIHSLFQKITDRKSQFKQSRFFSIAGHRCVQN